MRSKLRSHLDPLDLKLVERAFESARASVKGNDGPHSEVDTDDELEASLRQELIEIALANGVGDAETLRDILLATLSDC
jgi:hypothetical protein